MASILAPTRTGTVLVAVVRSTPWRSRPRPSIGTRSSSTSSTGTGNITCARASTDSATTSTCGSPCPGGACAGVRRRSPMAAGAGDTVADFDYPEPDPAPFTTIAWRMAHLSVGVFGTGPPTTSVLRAAWSTTRSTGRSMPPAGWSCSTISTTHGSAGVRSLGNDGLDRQCGSHEGPFAHYSMAALVLHISPRGDPPRLGAVPAARPVPRRVRQRVAASASRSTSAVSSSG